MNTIECIKTRRSIRKFLPDPIPQKTIEMLIGVAAWAPSWKNTQTTRYIALTGNEKNAIAEIALGGNNRSITENAPLLIALCSEKHISGCNPDGSYRDRFGTHWESFDSGIACRTLCLAAHDLGIGTVIMGIYDPQKAHEYLKLPESIQVSALIAAGIPAENPDPRPRKDVSELLTFFHE